VHLPYVVVVLSHAGRASNGLDSTWLIDPLASYEILERALFMHIVLPASAMRPLREDRRPGRCDWRASERDCPLGHEVTVYLPFYRQVREKVTTRKLPFAGLTIPFESYNRFVAILDGGKHRWWQIYFVDFPRVRS